MSCSCGCNPCSCTPSPSVCCAPTVESVTYTFENANLVGIGFFDNETDRLVQFRGAVSNSAALTITLDAGNNVLVFDFDDEALVLDLPDATTTQRGILETATNAEALAKAATDKILTPSNLAALGSTTTFAGLVELATDAETIAGVSTTLAVTPAGLAAASVLSGTTTFVGAVERAAAVATFDGQFGTQLDTEQAYVAGSTAAGDWNSILTFGANNFVSATTSVQMGGFGLTLVGNGDFVLQNTTFSSIGSASTFENSTTNFGVLAGNPQVVNLANAVLQVAGVDVPNNSVLVTAGGVGIPSSRLLNTFLSTANTSTYGIPSGTLARTTFTAYNGQTVSNPPTQAEMQIVDNALVIVSQRLAALITDLIVTLKPTA